MLLLPASSSLGRPLWIIVGQTWHLDIAPHSSLSTEWNIVNQTWHLDILPHYQHYPYQN